MLGREAWIAYKGVLAGKDWGLKSMLKQITDDYLRQFVTIFVSLAERLVKLSVTRGEFQQVIHLHKPCFCLILHKAGPTNPCR